MRLESLGATVLMKAQGKDAGGATHLPEAELVGSALTPYRAGERETSRAKATAVWDRV